MSTKRPIRCAIYTRKSTEEGLEQDFNSLDAQREACQSYIASQKGEGWIALGDRYDDGGYSGGTLQRPALKRLLAEIEAGSVDVVVVYKIDRLSRSLMDFSRLVELFDRKSVTFVSVTQSFNTTTSMGRLTLNVLLSFAQFEREVTGERIRDKFAASKKKGIWMGGNPPLGYDVANRKLVVNPAEAETVRQIFRRYLELGCVRLLCEELAAQGAVSKRRTFVNGETRGGRPLGRSALYAVLNNRVYVGETIHKGASYRGEHDAIVDQALFDSVKRHLADLAPRLTSATRAAQDAPYAGLIFDDTGAAMAPTYSIKSGRIRYRYYASKPTMRGERSNASISRIPAPPFEAFLAATIQRIGLSSNVDPIHTRAIVRRIDILANSVLVRFDRAETLALWRARVSGAGAAPDKGIIADICRLLGNGETLTDDGDQFRLSMPVRAQFRGGRAAIHFPTPSVGASPRVDMALIKALARAHYWRKMLLNGEVDSIEAIAKRFDLDRGHVRLTLKLAYLSPQLTRTIVRGEQPSNLRLTHLLASNLPLSWERQSLPIFTIRG